MAAAPASTITVSTNGQIALPKAVRERRHWSAGTRLVVEERPEGVLLRAVVASEPTKYSDVFGSLKWDGPPVSIEEMDAAVLEEARRGSR